MTEWRYLRYGLVVHALSTDHVRDWSVAECGICPRFLESWYGTGNQAEYEHAAGLPRCKRCLANVTLA